MVPSYGGYGGMQLFYPAIYSSRTYVKTSFSDLIIILLNNHHRHDRPSRLQHVHGSLDCRHAARSNGAGWKGSPIRHGEIRKFIISQSQLISSSLVSSHHSSHLISRLVSSTIISSLARQSPILSADLVEGPNDFHIHVDLPGVENLNVEVRSSCSTLCSMLFCFHVILLHHLTLLLMLRILCSTYAAHFYLFMLHDLLAFCSINYAATFSYNLLKFCFTLYLLSNLLLALTHFTNALNLHNSITRSSETISASLPSAAWSMKPTTWPTPSSVHTVSYYTRVSHRIVSHPYFNLHLFAIFILTLFLCPHLCPHHQGESSANSLFLLELTLITSRPSTIVVCWS